MRFFASLFVCLTLLMAPPAVATTPLVVGYSDWPGWVAWEIALEKGWFEEAGVAVTFEWFDYAASMEAYSAGQLDAVCMTNGDTLVTGATGRGSQMMLINDFSNGNDMVIARPGVSSVAELAGGKVGVEVGFVSHLLLLQALESAGLGEDDVELINVRTNETPMVLASGDVDAIVAWQPNSSQSLQMSPGSTTVYSSSNAPGLIYDVLAVAPESLANRRSDWQKVFDVWYRVVDYLAVQENRAEAMRIMAGRVGISPEAYAEFFEGTRFLSRAEAGERYVEREGLDSLWGSTRLADAFNVRYGVYDTPQDVASYIDASFYR